MSPSLRLGLFYSAIFIGSGAASPYLPVWLKHHGLSGTQIGLLFALPQMARIVTAPAIAVWADGFALRRTALALLSLGVVGAYALMGAPLGFVGWTVVWFVAASLNGALAPLVDVMALARSRRDGFNFGWPRGIGSSAFIIGNVGMGALLARYSPDLVLIWMLVSAALTVAVAAFVLPPDPVHEDAHPVADRADRWAGVGELLRDRGFMAAVIAAGLIQSAHAFYYGFSTLSWKAQGIPDSLTGILWAVGVAAEVVFLWFLEPWRRRIGPRRLLALGGVAAVVRWTAFAFAPPLWLVFPLQTLHAFSYAATFLASVQLVERLSSPRNASAAQSINSALSGGVLMGLASLASGWTFDHCGAGGYLLMSAMCVAGLIAAVRLNGEARLAAR